MKQGARQVVHGALALSVAQVAANLASFVMSWSVARGMGDAAYGTFAAAYALATSVAALADSGVRMALIREVARHPGEWAGLLRHALLISAALGGLIALVFLALASIQDASVARNVRVWLLAYALAWTAIRIALGVLAGRDRMPLAAAWGAWERIAGAMVVAGWAFSGETSLSGMARALFVVELAMLFGLLAWLGRQSWPAAPSRLTLRAFAREALPFGVSAALYAVLGRMDLIVLGFQQPPGPTGHYAAAQNLVLVMMFVVISISSAMFPSLTRLARDGRESEARRMLMPALGVSVLLIASGAAVLMAGARWWLELVYGREFAEGARWLDVFALMSVLPAIGAIQGSVIAAWGWQGRWARTVAWILGLGAPAVWLAGDLAGFAGVAAAMAIMQFVLVRTAWRWMLKAGLHDDRWWLARVGAVQCLTGGVIALAGVGSSVAWLLPVLTPVAVVLSGVCRWSWVCAAVRMGWRAMSGGGSA